MANLPIYGYGEKAGNAIPSYGFAGESVPPTIIPSLGAMRGGDVYTIVGPALSNAPYRDTFTGVGLDPILWTDESILGTATTSPLGLVLSLPSTGGFAGIDTASRYGNFDVSVEYSYDATIENFRPSTRITFCHLKAYFDANTYAIIEHVWDPDRGSAVVFSVVSDGSVRGTATTFGKASHLRTLRLVRFGGRVQGWFGNTLLLDHTGWIEPTVILQVGSENTVTPIPVSTVIKRYTPDILVTFGNEIAPLTNEPSPNRVVGSIPAAQLPGPVDVQVHTIKNGTSTISVPFIYFAPLQLTLSEGSGVLIVSNDDTLRDTSDALPGLRL